jgi:hypothetical protein
MSYPIELLRKSTSYGRTLREMCGEYHPENRDKNKRWYLPVNGTDVPVFYGKRSKAEYPEIRVHPFWDTDATYMGRAYGYSSGIEENGEFPDLVYTRGRADTTLQEARSVIEIYARKTEELHNIRDKMFERFERFRLAEAAQVVDKEDWVEDGNVYINAKYDSNLGIIRVYDLEERLIKTSDVHNTQGSWNIDKDGLIVNPLTEIDNISMSQIYNRGLAFSNGDLIAARGIMSIKIVRSKQEKDEIGPDVPKWSIHILAKYKDVMIFDVGEAYSKVNINEEL